MRQLVPVPLPDVDAYAAYRPDDPKAPLLRLNMVMSADGSVTDERGRAGGLGGEADREVFRTLRALADAILVGAQTARTEGYGPHRVRADLAERRRGDGRDAPAAVVVVSRSLDLDYRGRLFTEAVTPTVVLTCQAADPGRRRAAERAARVLVAGEATVDLAAGLGLLRSELGLAHVVCEGGPTLNAALLSAGLVDELCLTIGPMLTGVDGLPLVRGVAPRVPLRLLSVLEAGGELMLRYTVG